MIKCTSPYAYDGDICVACMNDKQNMHGLITCDMAKECNFVESRILEQCQYAKKKKFVRNK